MKMGFFLILLLHSFFGISCSRPTTIQLGLIPQIISCIYHKAGTGNLVSLYCQSERVNPTKILPIPMKPALFFAPFSNPIRAQITNELEKPKEDSFRYPLFIRIICTLYYSFTLSTYSPVLVLIRIVSPSFTNKGTFTVAPVSTVAGLRARVAVSPFRPGSQ